MFSFPRIFPPLFFSSRLSGADGGLGWNPLTRKQCLSESESGLEMLRLRWCSVWLILVGTCASTAGGHGPSAAALLCDTAAQYSTRLRRQTFFPPPQFVCTVKAKHTLCYPREAFGVRLAMVEVRAMVPLTLLHLLRLDPPVPPPPPPPPLSLFSSLLLLSFLSVRPVSSSPLCHSYFSLLIKENRLVGRVVTRPLRERKIPGSKLAWAGIFSGSSHTSDLKIGTPVATLPGAWRYRVSAGTGRPGVSILWLGEVERLISFYLSVAST